MLARAVADAVRRALTSPGMSSVRGGAVSFSGGNALQICSVFGEQEAAALMNLHVLANGKLRHDSGSIPNQTTLACPSSRSMAAVNPTETTAATASAAIARMIRTARTTNNRVIGEGHADVSPPVNRAARPIAR